LREGNPGPTEPIDVEQALTEYLDRPELTAAEEKVVATHEAGHALCALHCPHAPPIDRISIRGDLAGSLGFVQYADRAHRYVVTRGQLLDNLCMLFGGREAEALLLEDISIGSAQDLEQATRIARALVQEFGMGGDATLAVQRFAPHDAREPSLPLSNATLEQVDAQVRHLLESQRQRARDILQRERGLLLSLRDLLLERKVLDREAFAHLVPSAAPKESSRG
jgi:cell division protease FtsH